MRCASISATAQARACSRMRGSEFVAAVGDEFFGIVEADDAALGIENDGGGDYGTE